MSVLYLLSTGSYLRKIKDRLLIGRADGSHKSLPIQNVEQIVLNKGGKITPEAVYALLEHRIPIIYVDFLGHVVGVLGNLPCSLQRSLCQMQYFSQEPQQILLIRSILAVKLENQQSLLKSYAKSKYHDELLKLAKQIARYAKRISQTDDIEVLRGLEGIATRTYFQAVPFMVDTDLWPWNGRNRRPPKDPLNAMLSYGYTFLEREVRVAIAGAGMDCRLGFFHSNTGTRDSLVFDFMELIRPNVIDRFVFRAVNLKIFSPEQFETLADGCRFTEEARKVWIYQYEKYMQVISKSCQDQTPREWIRSQIEDFARHLFTASDTTL